MDALLKERAERKAIKRQMFDDSDEEVDTTEETSTLHVDGKDYQGRNYINPPHDVDVILTKDNPPERCFLPKKLVHTYKSHTKAVTSIEQFPLTGHLILSSSMDGKVKIWETYGKRRLLRTYCGHNKAIILIRDKNHILSRESDAQISPTMARSLCREHMIG